MTSQVLETHLKKANIRTATISTIAAILTFASIGFGFYYNTKDIETLHTDEIKSLKVDVKELKNIVTSGAVTSGASTEQIKSLDTRVTRIETTMDRIEDKIDKVIIQTRN